VAPLRLGYARPARHHGSGRDVRINRQAATYRNRNAVANNRATSSDDRIRGADLGEARVDGIGGRGRRGPRPSEPVALEGRHHVPRVGAQEGLAVHTAGGRRPLGATQRGQESVLVDRDGFWVVRLEESQDAAGVAARDDRQPELHRRHRRGGFVVDPVPADVSNAATAVE
jgi:hypothetical protein